MIFLSDPKVLCLGLIQSLFEGSMYSFVLEWTPALTPSKFTHGLEEQSELKKKFHISYCRSLQGMPFILMFSISVLILKKVKRPCTASQGNTAQYLSFEMWSHFKVTDLV